MEIWKGFFEEVIFKLRYEVLEGVSYDKSR